MYYCLIQEKQSFYGGESIKRGGRCLTAADINKAASWFHDLFQPCD